jgi:thiamine transport system ATP-binding protein
MLSLENVSVRYGAVTALSGVTLSVAEGEKLSLLGPSGSGKSTLLRVVAGLEPPADGRVAWDGRDLAPVPVHARGFGLMFQDYVLFPHHDVARNVAFGLRMRGEPAAAIRHRVGEVLEMVGLAGYERRRPTELSGGEQQRVALARALAPRPRLLMLDEPLGALDRSLRQRLLVELADLFVALSLTVLYVTHDQEEALAVGDRVALMRAGRLEAVMPPEELWNDPPSEFAARFLGLSNIADAVPDGAGRLLTAWGGVPAPTTSGDPPRRILLRPDGFFPDPDGPIRGTVRGRRFHGEYTALEIEGRGGELPLLEVHARWSSLPAVGQEIALSVRPEAVVPLVG